MIQDIYYILEIVVQTPQNLSNALDTARALTAEMRKHKQPLDTSYAHHTIHTLYVLSYLSAGRNYNPVQRPEIKLNIKVKQKSTSTKMSGSISQSVKLNHFHQKKHQSVLSRDQSFSNHSVEIQRFPAPSCPT